MFIGAKQITNRIDMRRFSDVLKEVQGRRTQTQTAKDLNVPLNTYTAWLRNERLPSYEALQSLSKTLGVSFAYLFGMPEARSAKADYSQLVEHMGVVLLTLANDSENLVDALVNLAGFRAEEMPDDAVEAYHKIFPIRRPMPLLERIANMSQEDKMEIKSAIVDVAASLMRSGQFLYEDAEVWPDDEEIVSTYGDVVDGEIDASEGGNAAVEDSNAAAEGEGDDAPDVSDNAVTVAAIVDESAAISKRKGQPHSKS